MENRNHVGADIKILSQLDLKNLTQLMDYQKHLSTTFGEV